jgi:hypothetical protein
MECYEDMDLSSVESHLKAVEARLEAAAAPTRAKLEALGPAGLFALAASEQARAEVEVDRAARRVRLVAARAAQTLAEQQLQRR